MWRSLLCLWVSVLAGPWAGAETLRIGFGTDKPPYIFEAERRGVEYDIVVEAAKMAGMTVEPFFAPMERLHYMQGRGELDGIASTNPAGGLKAFFSKSYIEYHNVAVALADRRLEIKTIGDLGKYSVSAFQRARKLLGPEFEAMAEKNPNYREEAQQITRNRLLYGERVDVIIGDRRIIEYFTGSISQQMNVRRPLVWYALFPPTPYSVAFGQESVRNRFDRGLETLRAGDGYHEIEKRYRSSVQ
ncbi:MAG TPA: ABC transporter substrate-binding protein [Rhodocyclaceae bacterium]|nr:ABC transporter substrate-binding protein [Rhodocyclaceae bacterium]